MGNIITPADVSPSDHIQHVLRAPSNHPRFQRGSRLSGTRRMSSCKVPSEEQGSLPDMSRRRGHRWFKAGYHHWAGINCHRGPHRSSPGFHNLCDRMPNHDARSLDFLLGQTGRETHLERRLQFPTNLFGRSMLTARHTFQPGDHDPIRQCLRTAVSTPQGPELQERDAYLVHHILHNLLLISNRQLSTAHNI